MYIFLLVCFGMKKGRLLSNIAIMCIIGDTSSASCAILNSGRGMVTLPKVEVNLF